MNPTRYIGCCGACCKICKAFLCGACRGCKLGFDTGLRDFGRARCRIKLCCFRDRGLATCADCPELDSCPVIGAWFAKKGFKYGKYRESFEFIRRHGYERFLMLAGLWENACGKPEEQRGGAPGKRQGPSPPFSGPTPRKARPLLETRLRVI
ncbi:MAG: DUF3795 domain-containing protein [Thermodesulfobacteriota bacterium]